MITAFIPAAGSAARALCGCVPLKLANPSRPKANATISKRVTTARRDRVAEPGVGNTLSDDEAVRCRRTSKTLGLASWYCVRLDARWAPFLDGNSLPPLCRNGTLGRTDGRFGRLRRSDPEHYESRTAGRGPVTVGRHGTAAT